MEARFEIFRYLPPRGSSISFLSLDWKRVVSPGRFDAGLPGDRHGGIVPTIPAILPSHSTLVVSKFFV